MSQHIPNEGGEVGASRRRFLQDLGCGVIAAGVVAGAAVPLAASEPVPQATRADKQPVAPAEPAASKTTPGTVRQRTLGKTGLKVSEIGFGGHSWSYKHVPDGPGGLRTPTLAEAERMITDGLEMGVNFFDACTPPEEHTVPGEVLRRLKKRDQVLVSARLCHKMKGAEQDKQHIYKFVDERLRLWQTDRFDLLMVTNEVGDTGQSGYWDMSYSIEALEKVKQQGKVRFVGFGCHFTPELFLEAFEKFGRSFDVVSFPYNVRHRAAEKLIPAAKKIGLGVVTIKPFARGELLRGRQLDGPDAGLARDMIAFVLQEPQVDVCLCGVHTAAQVRENFSASWTKLPPERRQRLEQLAAATACPGYQWLEQGWRYA